MKFLINIEKKHFYLLAIMISVLGIFTVFAVQPFNPALPLHPLQQISIDELGVVSVDADGNSIIDNSDNLQGLSASAFCKSDGVDCLAGSWNTSGSNILVRHSQTTSLPSTPSGWTKLWDGYSYVLTSGGGGMSGSQDLGTEGSCLPEFRPMPFIECSSPNTCDYFTPGDFSYWLSTRTSDEGPVSGTSIISRISRCTVFESNKPILVLHSQTTSVPSIPSGWTKLWDGYSYVLTSGSGGFSGSQDLGTAGSCLPEFRPIAMIECSSPNTCDYYTGGDFSYWLSTRTVDEGGVSGGNIISRISRCTVFTK